MKAEERPTLAITMGDPAGIGPEVTLKALCDPNIRQKGRYVIVGDANVLRHTAQQIGVLLPEAIVSRIEDCPADAGICILDVDALDAADYATGRLSAACGCASVAYIEAATRLCLEGVVAAMITGPVNKEAVTLAGIPFTGHTEYIAALCGVSESRMLLVNAHLRVVHVSTHRSLRSACDLDVRRILETIRLGNRAVQWLGVERPRLAVCGLNPHAGEHGLFGTEDSEFIVPAVEAAQAEGVVCEGPLPADTLFFKAARGAYDLVVAMYHDQGHIPMKLLDFEHTVNVSLGLPIIRTSVDHGTAFDIVGKNLADADSMKAALRLAATMTRNREQRVGREDSPMLAMGKEIEK
jgi:4-phospho-D-threonate 3-dehydrogenase / 4-phospho-D-erythronate 3-dehydrogenase